MNAIAMDPQTARTVEAPRTQEEQTFAARRYEFRWGERPDEVVLISIVGPVSELGSPITHAFSPASEPALRELLVAGARSAASAR